jgi:hypothetical protein
MLKYLPEELSKKKRSRCICGIKDCKNLALAEIPVKNSDDSFMWVLICHKHLSLIRRCKNCIDYRVSSETKECRNPAPYQTMLKTRLAKWAFTEEEEWCGQWKPKEAMSLEELRKMKGK